MSPRLIRLLASTSFSPQAGVTGLSVLTALINRLVRGRIPDATIPLLAAATLLPIQQKPGKIRPIAVGQCLRRLVTKVLLPGAVADTRDLLSPEKMANSIPSGMDAIVHDARMLTRLHGTDPNYVMVSIDAKNAFNSFCRQRLLHQLPNQAPSLARFMDLLYARCTPPLIIPSSPPTVLQSKEGAQQGCPASMLLFSLAIQPLVRKISAECNLLLNRWFADDGTLIGTIFEVAKALRILISGGPAFQFNINPSKTRVFWPSMHNAVFTPLTSVVPELDTAPTDGIMLLGAPIGTPAFMGIQIDEKLVECDATLDLVATVPNASIRFHLHRLTASACRVQHLFRLVPPDFAYPYAQRFDSSQISAYCKFNQVSLSPDASRQVCLTFRLGGHGFYSMAATVHASHAASLIEAAPCRLSGPPFPSVAFYRLLARRSLRVVASSLPVPVPRLVTPLTPSSHSLGWLDPEHLATRPERPHHKLFQALHEARASSLWDESLWQSFPNPVHHSPTSVRRRARVRSILAFGATAFLTAHPSSSSHVSNTICSTMLRRHLGLPVYTDSIRPLICAHCGKQMDSFGDHATVCRHGFGLVHRHNTVRNTLARHLFKPAGLAYSLEVPFLIPGTSHRPADILVQPCPPSAGLPPDKPTAYDVTVHSPYRQGTLLAAARRSGGAAELAETQKRNRHARVMRAALQIRDEDPIPPIDWHFVPLAFDTLCAPSASTASVISDTVKRISSRTTCPYGSLKLRVYQRLSYALWSSIAAAIHSRTPTHGLDLSHPLPV